MTDIDALEELDYFGGDKLTILKNSLLSTCEAMALKDELTGPEWEGFVCIFDNDYDCPGDGTGCNRV